MTFSITPIGGVLIIGLMALLYKDFFREKRLATANGGNFVFKDCLKKFYIDVFYLYVCVVLFTNLGYFVKIGTFDIGYSFVLSLVLFCIAVILIFSERLYDKKLMIIGGVFTLSCGIGLALAYIFSYKGGYIDDISKWDLYVLGQTEKVYGISPSLTHFKYLFNIAKYAVILSVTKATMDFRRVWDKLLDIINVIVVVVVVYGFFEVFSDKVIGKSPIGYFFNPIFGEADATFNRTDRFQGLYKEASHYALYLFYIALFEMIYLLTKKGGLTKKRLIVEYIKMALLILLMVISTSFSALILLPLLYVFFVRYIINPKHKLDWFLCSIAVAAFAMVVIANGEFSRWLGLNALNEKFNELINVLYDLFSGKNVGISSVGARFTSIFEMIKIFAARPMFGIGVGITDAHTTFFSILACTGVIGTALWITVILNFGRFTRNNVIFAIIMLISTLFVGGIGYIAFIVYPVLFFYVGRLFPGKRKRIKKIVIDGLSLEKAKRITGIERVCREMLLRFDNTLAKEFPMEYFCSANATHNIIHPDELKNIKCVTTKCKNHNISKLIVLPSYVKKNNGLCVCLPVEIMVSRGQISSVYDLRPVTFNNCDSPSFRRAYKRMLLLVKLFSSVIVTDSDYQKEEIIKYFKIKNGSKKVYTVYPGWEHLKELKEDKTIFDKFNEIKKGEYFYSLGSLAPHKNFKWVMEVAKRNPNKQFVIAGGKDLKIWKEDISEKEQKNLIFTGYVSDEENKALMAHCRAFIFPSIYEGFGIPPLEALFCGAKVLCSNATCLPEIYEDTVVYFDPYDYDVDIEKLLQQPVADPVKIFAKCSWEKAAEKWREIILNQLYAEENGE